MYIGRKHLPGIRKLKTSGLGTILSGLLGILTEEGLGDLLASGGNLRTYTALAAGVLFGIIGLVAAVGYSTGSSVSAGVKGRKRSMRGKPVKCRESRSITCTGSAVRLTTCTTI